MTFPFVTDEGRYRPYIDGEWRDSGAVEWYDNLNPAHPETVLGRVPECTTGEVDRAVQAANRAFEVWRGVSGNVRTKLFLKLAQILERDYDRLVATMTREMGKTLFDSRLDLDEAIGVVECVAPQGLSLKGETYQRNAAGVVMESRLEPRGVAAIVTPFNFPLAIPIAQVVSALVTGNTVVWKPSHLVPESSIAIAAALEEAFAYVEGRHGAAVPEGTFNMVFGDQAAGDALIRHPDVRCVSFTGSKVVGDAVDAIASGLGKRVMKEVGGVNVFYVHREADLDRAARNFVYGKTITGGQRCTSIQEACIDDAVYESFVERVLKEAAGIVSGDGASEALDKADRVPGQYSLPPLVSGEQRARVLALLAESVTQGASIRYQGPSGAEGFYVPFTLLEEVGESNVLYRTEIFGPVGVLRRVSGVVEAIERINDRVGIVACIDSVNKDVTEHFIQSVLRTRVDDGRHGTGAFWATRFGGDRGAGSGNPALDENMVYGYVMWKTIYRSYRMSE
ncbi:MAG: aldehyde dehydrogenase family protein [Capsulimonadaceae bacterium]